MAKGAKRELFPPKVALGISAGDLRSGSWLVRFRPPVRRPWSLALFAVAGCCAGVGDRHCSLLLVWDGSALGAASVPGFGGEERELEGSGTGGDFVLNFVLDFVLRNSALALTFTLNFT